MLRYKLTIIYGDNNLRGSTVKKIIILINVIFSLIFIAGCTNNTGNLDSKMGAEVMELLHRLNKEDGRTIVMVTHNEEQAKQTSRTIRFFDGRQVQ